MSFSDYLALFAILVAAIAVVRAGRQAFGGRK